MNEEKTTRERRVLWKDGRRCAGAFFMISQEEIEKALAAKLPASAWALWNYVGVKVSGNPEGWRIGIEEIKTATGLSGPSIWRASVALDKAGLVHRERAGVNRWTLCDGFCDKCTNVDN
jgi:hypothetical protein